MYGFSIILTINKNEMKKIDFMGAELTTLQFTGRKTVEAVPMKRSEAEMACGRVIPGETDAEGYLVIYPDGYRSWSPKEVFEEAYKISETYHDRMLIEAMELSEKINKAAGYLKNHSAPMLCKQMKAMLDYKMVLDERIEMDKIFDELTKRSQHEAEADDRQPAADCTEQAETGAKQEEEPEP